MLIPESKPTGTYFKAQKWLILFLVLWLVLVIARQTFDLIGKLWIPVAFNLLQILSCISGLFAAIQCRGGLLIALSISTFFSIVYNVFLILWYNNWLWLGHREDPLLSAGLPYSYSFFLRHTPFCGSQFNLSLSQWQQDADCVLPYYNVETFQAIIHVVFAILTMIFSILTLIDRKKLLENKYAAYAASRSTNSSKSMKKAHKNDVKIGTSTNIVDSTINDPNLAARININPNYSRDFSNKNQILLTAPDSINDLSSGYMNSSYDSQIEPNAQTFAQNNPNLQSKFRKSHQKPNTILMKQNKNNTFKNQTIPTNVDEYSSATTAELNSVESGAMNSLDNDDSLPPPPTASPPRLPIPNNLLASGRSLSNGMRTPIPRPTTPLSLQPHPNMENPNELSSSNLQRTNQNASTRIYARNNSTTTSSNRFQNRQISHQLSENSADLISGDYLKQVGSLELGNGAISSPFYTEPDKKRYSKFQRDTFNENLNGQNGTFKAYPPNQIRPSTASINSSMDSSGYLEFLSRNSERRSSTNNLTSLVSFDPKSNTLLRVREHQNDSSGDEENFQNHRQRNFGEKLLDENSNVKDFNENRNLQSREMSVSQDSVPSIMAPVLSPQYCCQDQKSLPGAFSSKPTTMEPIRQRVAFNSQDRLKNSNNILNNDGESSPAHPISTNFSIIPPSTSNGNLYTTKNNEKTTFPQKTNSISQSHLLNNNNNNNSSNIYSNNFNAPLICETKTNNNSIYECFEGPRPTPSTAFPVDHHQRQRSVAGVCVASAIRLADDPSSSSFNPPSNSSLIPSCRDSRLPDTTSTSNSQQSQFSTTTTPPLGSGICLAESPQECIRNGNFYANSRQFNISTNFLASNPLPNDNNSYFPIYNADRETFSNSTTNFPARNDKKTPIFPNSDTNGLLV